jgi:hypothetical protein
MMLCITVSYSSGPHRPTQSPIAAFSRNKRGLPQRRRGTEVERKEEEETEEEASEGDYMD